MVFKSPKSSKISFYYVVNKNKQNIGLLVHYLPILYCAQVSEDRFETVYDTETISYKIISNRNQNMPSKFIGDRRQTYLRDCTIWYEDEVYNVGEVIKSICLPYYITSDKVREYLETQFEQIIINNQPY